MFAANFKHSRGLGNSDGHETNGRLHLRLRFRLLSRESIQLGKSPCLLPKLLKHPADRAHLVVRGRRALARAASAPNRRGTSRSHSEKCLQWTCQCSERYQLKTNRTWISKFRQQQSQVSASSLCVRFCTKLRQKNRVERSRE